METIAARAHTNIALIKYWGKADQKLIIPTNNSLSLTLDRFYTDTTVQFDPNLKEDQIIFNQKQIQFGQQPKMRAFMDLIRQKAEIPYFACIQTENHVPTAAGLASSASGLAALATAASHAAGMQLTPPELSRLARRGSGSACRSIYGGFVEWEKGHDDLTSLARPFQEEVNWDIQMLVVVVNRNEKNITSREGMQHTVATSPFYQQWIETAQKDLIEIKKAIQQRDLKLVGEIAENNALAMHATTLSARPGFTYFEPETLIILDLIRKMRREGLNCYATIDAGPNVKIICSSIEAPIIKRKIKNILKNNEILTARPGSGVSYQSVSTIHERIND